MRIYNSLGELVQKRWLYWSTTQLQYYTDALKNGLYFIEVQSDAGAKASARVLVVH